MMCVCVHVCKNTYACKDTLLRDTAFLGKAPLRTVCCLNSACALAEISSVAINPSHTDLILSLKRGLC